MQARGMGGSGAELMAQLASSQASADTASAGADNIAAQASQNKIQQRNANGDLMVTGKKTFKELAKGTK